MVLPWSRSTPGLPELESIEECASVLQLELVILFKHSPTCPVSWMAHREVMQYRTAQPEVPLFLISVRRRRDVARYVVEKTGVHHESPQIIVLRRGQVIASSSHDDIAAETMKSFVGLQAEDEQIGAPSATHAEPVPSSAS